MVEPHIDTTDGIRLYARVFEPSSPVRAALCLVHGFGEHGGRYAHVAAALNARGIAVLAADLRGHGKSPGRRGCAPSYAAVMDDVGSMLAATQDRWPGVPLFLYGHSMGGNLVLNYVLHREPRLAGVVASSPWLRLSEPKGFLMDAFAALMTLLWPGYAQLTGNDPGNISRDPAVLAAKAADPLCHDRMGAGMYTWVRRAGEYVLRHAAGIRLPLLVMHGSCDKLIDPAPSALIAEKVPGCTYRSWEGFYHALHNDTGRDGVIGYMVAWMEARIG